MLNLTRYNHVTGLTGCDGMIEDPDGEYIRVEDLKNETNKPITKLLKVITDYRNIFCESREIIPMFVLTNEAYKIFSDPEILELNKNLYTPYHLLPSNIQSLPGVVGIYNGVLLIYFNKG